MVGGAYAEDPQGWKRPWGMGGCGLGSTEQKGPRCASHLWSQRVEDPTWEPSRLPEFEWAGQSPLLLSGSSGSESPSHLPLCSLLASLLHPQDQPGPEGTSEG